MRNIHWSLMESRPEDRAKIELVERIGTVTREEKNGSWLVSKTYELNAKDRNGNPEKITAWVGYYKKV